MTQQQRAIALVVVAAALGFCVFGAKATGHSAPAMGILVLAHGGQPQWNTAVRQAVDEAGLPQPARIAFGMGMEAAEVTALQQAVTELEAAGVEEIVAVPLLVSPDSEVMRQYEYLLGMRAEPEFQGVAPPPAGFAEGESAPTKSGQARRAPAGGGVAPVARRVPIVMTNPLGGHELVAQIVLERAQRLSEDSSAETVILVAHGPVTEADNTRWLDTLSRLGGWVQQHGQFRRVEAATLRDDAPEAVQDAATAALRQLVSSAAEQGRVLVVPVLVAPGGIEHKIRERLEGLTYQFSGETLLPHPNISRWIAEQVTDGSGARPESLL